MSRSVTGLITGSAAALVAAVAIVASSPATVEAASLKGGVWHDVKGRTCTSTSTCLVDSFTPIPAGRTVFLKRATCTVSNVSGVAVYGISVLAKPSNTIAGFLAPITTQQGSTYPRHSVNAEILYALSAGERPSVQVVLDGISAAITVNCTVTGTLTL